MVPSPLLRSTVTVATDAGACVSHGQVRLPVAMKPQIATNFGAGPA